MTVANEIEEYQEPAEIAPTKSSNLLDQIVSAARDPSVQPEKMKAMADLAIMLQEREQRQEFNRDMNAAILEMPVITKAGKIVIKKDGRVIQSTPFAKFEDLDRVVKSIVRRHNLSYNFDCGGDAQRLLVSLTLRHANGYVERTSAMPLPLETSGSKNNVQGAGSTNTYGKRYVLQNTFAIVTEGEDDDGNQGAAVSLPQEREVLVLEEAEAAFEAGRYVEWFRSQSPKDRAFMVGQPGHAERMAAGAPPALQGPGSAETYDKAQQVDAVVEQAGQDPQAARQALHEEIDERVIEQDSEPPAPTVEEQAAEQRRVWVGRYIVRVENVPTLDALAELQQTNGKTLAKIRESYTDLQELILAAHNRAFDRLKADDEAVGDGDLFGQGES
jgi:hypothetical protein